MRLLCGDSAFADPQSARVRTSPRLDHVSPASCVQCGYGNRKALAIKDLSNPNRATW
jgi:hypothetical protein